MTGALEKFRRVGIRKDNGHLSDDYFCNYRRDTDCDWLFICHGKHVPKNSYGKFDRLRITIAGEFTPVLYDTLSGKISNPEYEVTDGKTVLHRDVYAYDSLLLRLMPMIRQSDRIYRKHIRSQAASVNTIRLNIA